MKLSCPISERGLLSGLYKYGSEVYFEVAPIINEDCFTIDSNAIIYKCLKLLIERDNNVKVDLPLVYSAAKELNLDSILQKKDEKEHLIGVISLPVEFSNAQKFAKKIKKLYIIRQLKNKCLDIAENKLQSLTGEEPITQILGITDEIIDYTTLIGKSEDEADLISNDVDAFVQNLIDNPVECVGYSVGYPRLNSVFGDGMLPGCIYGIGSRTGGGKSLITVNMALHTSEKLGIPTLIVDNELSKELNLYRILACMSGVTIKEIRTGKFGKNIVKIDKVRKAKERLKKSNLHYLNVANLDFIDQLSGIRRWIMKDVGLRKDGSSNPCVIFYDYLKLSDTQGISNNMSERQLLGIMTTQLLNIAIKFQSPSIAILLQLNRDGIVGEGQEVVAGSDAILRPLSAFSIFKPLSVEEINEYGANYTHKIVTSKSRHSGVNFNEFILYKMDGEIGKITEIKTNLELINDHNNDHNNNSGFIVDDAKQVGDEEDNQDEEDGAEEKINKIIGGGS